MLGSFHSMDALTRRQCLRMFLALLVAHRFRCQCFTGGASNRLHPAVPSHGLRITEKVW